MKERYTLEVLRNKAYRKAYTGKQSRCFTRLVEQVSERARIRRESDGAIIFQREATLTS